MMNNQSMSMMQSNAGSQQNAQPLRQPLQQPGRSNQQITALEFDEAKETLDIIYEMSKILNCGLDQKTLSILVSLVENGVNPEALAAVVKELKRETGALRAANN